MGGREGEHPAARTGGSADSCNNPSVLILQAFVCSLGGCLRPACGQMDLQNCTLTFCASVATCSELLLPRLCPATQPEPSLTAMAAPLTGHATTHSSLVHCRSIFITIDGFSVPVSYPCCKYKWHCSMFDVYERGNS